MLHLGERLSEERIKRGYSLEEVSKATKIRQSFLSAIENGEYKKLPSSTYVHGFVKNYARFLGLPEYEILALFKRGYDEKTLLKVLPDGLPRTDDFSISKFKFTQTSRVILLIFFVLLVYIIFQYRSAIFDPSLSVSAPSENSIVSSQEIVVTGNTDANATVYVNSELAVLDKDGNFKKTISVFPGREKIIIKSINSFKRTTTVERDIEVKI